MHTHLRNYGVYSFLINSRRFTLCTNSLFTYTRVPCVYIRIRPNTAVSPHRSWQFRRRFLITPVGYKCTARRLHFSLFVCVFYYYYYYLLVGKKSYKIDYSTRSSATVKNKQLSYNIFKNLQNIWIEHGQNRISYYFFFY